MIDSLYCLICTLCALVLFLFFICIAYSTVIIALPFHILKWKEAVDYIIGTVEPLLQGLNQKNTWLLNEVINTKDRK